MWRLKWASTRLRLRWSIRDYVGQTSGSLRPDRACVAVRLFRDSVGRRAALKNQPTRLAGFCGNWTNSWNKRAANVAFTQKPARKLNAIREEADERLCVLECFAGAIVGLV